MKNSLTDLQNHLFSSLERLNDEDKAPDVDREKAIAAVAHQLIESAKVQVRYLEVTQSNAALNFFREKSKSLPDYSDRTVN